MIEVIRDRAVDRRESSRIWQVAILVAAAIALFALRRVIVTTLVAAGVIAGAPLPG